MYRSVTCCLVSILHHIIVLSIVSHINSVNVHKVKVIK
jgi:hypothetical protein